MKVEVYWNLHKQLWSVRHNGRVIDHTHWIRLKDVRWVVQPAGNARVRRENKKNVHAFARGTLGPDKVHIPPGLHIYTVKYNPYENTTFVRCHDNAALNRSEYAVLTCTFDATPNKTFPTPMALIQE